MLFSNVSEQFCLLFTCLLDILSAISFLSHNLLLLLIRLASLFVDDQCLRKCKYFKESLDILKSAAYLESHT